MRNRTITVKGLGQASLPPDYIEIPLYLETKDEVYTRAIELANTKFEQLQTCLNQVGFENVDLKTISFNVDTDYEQVKNEAGEYVSVFRGYVIRHRLKIGFDFNQQKLGEVIEVLSKCPARPEFSIQYQLKSEAKLKSLILQDAVKNATEQANVLADAAGVDLGPVQAIDYDWVNDPYQPQELMLNENLDYSVDMMNLQPEDIKASYYVTLIWELL